MKGIILAGGSGTRLHPLTKVTSKQLLPVYDKPMIYYPLSILMLAGIKDILIISTPVDTPRFEELLGNGKNFGINLSYAIQEKPEGLAQAFLIGEKFIGKDSICMILGDNIFYGNGLKKLLNYAVENSTRNKATIFGYYVNDPERFGVAEFDKNGSVLSIEEKPKNPKSNYAVTGLYFYDNTVIEKAKKVKPSDRGELEITSINQMYLEQGKLDGITMGRGFTWLDTGTIDSLYKASEFVRIIEENQGIKIGCLEEISYINGWISKDDVLKIAKSIKNKNYSQHLYNVISGNIIHDK